MGLYSKYILPRLVHMACNTKSARRQREKIIPQARGRVLEIGIGSGLNLPLYDPRRVRRVWGLDPSRETWELRDKRRFSDFDVEFLEGSAEAIALEAGSADTVVMTYTLCTLPDVAGSLAEIRRVLASGGELLFCEHGAAPDPRVRRWQDRLTPVWSRLGGGCNLNRPVPHLLERSGFEMRELNAMYTPGWKVASFQYWGAAVLQGPAAR